MQNLFKHTFGTANYQTAQGVLKQDALHACGSRGENVSGSPMSEATLDRVSRLRRRTNTSRQHVQQASIYGDETWLSDIAYKALSNWRFNKRKDSSTISGTNRHSCTNTGATACNGTEATGRQLQLIKAMIAAARSDGEIGATERERILTAIEEMGMLPEIEAKFTELLDQPLAADSLASSIDDIESKAEIYLASCLAIDSYDRSEMTYLAQLESALRLPNGLAEKLQWHAQRTNKLA